MFAYSFKEMDYFGFFYKANANAYHAKLVYLSFKTIEKIKHAYKI